MIVCMKVVKLQSVSCSVVIRCGKANGAVTTDGTYRVYSIFGQCTECMIVCRETCDKIGHRSDLIRSASSFSLSSQYMGKSIENRT